MSNNIKENMRGSVRVSSISDKVSRNKPMTPSTGRILATSILGVVVSIIFCTIVIILYNNWVKYPPKMEIPKEKTGIYCLSNWETSLENMESLGENSYIAQEVNYANGNELKLNFCKKMLSTVSYTPAITTQKNIYGNEYIDIETNKTVSIPSTVEEGEEVTLSYIDYDSIEIDEAILEEIMKNRNIKLGDVDYENKLVDVFCEYMLGLDYSSIVKTEIVHIPSMSKNVETGEFYITEEEDIFIDKLLFSSKEFYSLLTRFSESAARVSGQELEPTLEWLEWNSMSDEVKNTLKEPNKYYYKQQISNTWCGSYYLQNEYQLVDSQGNVIQTGISANTGDGSFNNPAGLDTSVLTVAFYEYKDEYGNIIEEQIPIKVTLREYGVSEDAITWFESKDERNRGIDVTSEVQYCYYKIEVQNLSDKTITITDNTALCDKNVNCSSRTGTMYGLTDTVTLQPDESAIIESWNRSTELNRKYVIWGQNFSRKAEPVWFRLLAGNIDDPTDEKGVYTNTTEAE